MKMQDLERATGVGRETIRFYIREGLLPQPERPNRNVAWYDESFVERIAHKVTVMHQGKILAEAPMAQVQGDPRVIDVYLGHAKRKEVAA